MGEEPKVLAPPNEKMGYAVLSLLCGLLSTALAVVAGFIAFIYFGIFLSAILAIVIVGLLAPTLSFAFLAFEGGGRNARIFAIVALVIGVLGPAGGCAGSAYGMANHWGGANAAPR